MSFFDHYRRPFRRIPTPKFGAQRFATSYPRGGNILDVARPRVLSTTVAANGVTVTVVFSEAVVGAEGQPFIEFDLNGPGVTTLAYVSGSGTNTIVFDTDGLTVYQGETYTLQFIPDPGVTDLAGNPMAAFSGAAVTNNSTQLVPLSIPSVLTGYSPSSNFYTDNPPTTIATIGDPVRTMTMAIGANAVAASDGVRPIRRANGLEFDGTKLLTFASGSTYHAAGTFTMYMVGTIASNGDNWMGISGSNTIIRYLDGNLYISPGFIINFSSVGGLVTGSRCLVRIRRTDANVVLVWGSGIALEQTNSAPSTVDFNFTAVGGVPGSGQLTSGNSLLEEAWVFNADLVATGDATAMDAYFAAKYGGLHLGV